MGLKKSYKIVRDQKSISKILRQLKWIYLLPQGYREDFLRAFLTFKFAVVYDIDQGKLVNLTDPSMSEYNIYFDEFPNRDFLG